jgi:integrase
MAHARKRNQTWQARWRLRSGKESSKDGFPSKKAAEAYGFQQEQLEKRYKNTKTSDLNLTVKEFIEDVWVGTLKVRKQTLLSYERDLNSHILPEFGNKVMAAIKPVDIETWSASLKKYKKLSPRTIEKQENLLAAILKKAVENEYLHVSPFKKLKRPKAKKINKVVPLTITQVRKLAGLLPAQYQLIVWICYYTGMRPSEALGLTWEQLNFKTKKIEIDRQLSQDPRYVHNPDGLKTAASYRTIGFAKDLQILIQAHVDTFGLGPNGLLLKSRTGGPWRYKDAARLYRGAAKAIGLKPGEGLHQLRHTCVSVLIHQGVNIKQIQEWVGHASITETLDTYGHLFPGSLVDIAEMLDSYALEHLDEGDQVAITA